MKKLLVVLFVTSISLNSIFVNNIKADDIRDFQIEGISVDKSLLDKFDKKFIEEKRKFFSKGQLGVDKEFSGVLIRDNLDNYEAMRFYFVSDDKRYIIKSLSGYKWFKKKADCLSLRDEIAKEVRQISSAFKEIPAKETKLKSIKGTRNQITFFEMKDKINKKYNAIKILCYDFENKQNKPLVQLSVEVSLPIFNTYMDNVYKK